MNRRPNKGEKTYRGNFHKIYKNSEKHSCFCICSNLTSNRAQVVEHCFGHKGCFEIRLKIKKSIDEFDMLNESI